MAIMQSDFRSTGYTSIHSDDPSDTVEDFVRVPSATLTTPDVDDVSRFEPLSFEDSQSQATSTARHFSSLSTLAQLALDVILMVPAILFLVYAGHVLGHDGRHMDLRPVPTLIEAARFGPTIFPIAYTVALGNCYRAFAAWKLERGIKVLMLEYMLGSRTLFSAVTTQLKFRSRRPMALVLVIPWILSPVGGQAALRVVETPPMNISTSSPVTYLEFKSRLTNLGSNDARAYLTLPAAASAFSAALASPRTAKLAGQDIYGNVKIPLVEGFESMHMIRGSGGWYDVRDAPNVTYSSILGLPFIANNTGTNITFGVQTSYLYTTCRVRHFEEYQFKDRLQYMRSQSRLTGAYSNGSTLALQVGHLPTNFTTTTRSSYEPTPMKILFTSFNPDGVTNSSCGVTTTHVEAEIFCHSTNCTVVRVRRSTLDDATPLLTVLDFDFETQTSATSTANAFFDSFVNATDTPWSYKWEAQLRPSPLELYFTEQDYPYSVESYGRVIWPIGDTLFSQRFSQLLNAWWIANIAPFAVTGNFASSRTSDYQIRTVSGNFIPDIRVLHCNRTWFIVLIVASSAMLIADILAAVFGTLRKGPDILDNPSSLLRDSPFVNVKSLPSTEDAVDHAKKLKDVIVVLGDSQTERRVGRMAIGTTDEVKAASEVDPKRVYC
jgi:hypothetical protein